MSTPDTAEIRTRVSAEIAAILNRPVQEIDLDSPLPELGIDSMGLIEILLFVEREYGLAMIETGLQREHLRTPAALVAYIAEHAQDGA